MKSPFTKNPKNIFHKQIVNKQAVQKASLLLRSFMLNYRLPIFLLGSGLILYFVLRQIQISELKDALLHIKWEYIPYIFLLTFLGLLIKAARWHFLIIGIKKCSFRELFNGTAIGHAMNLLLPINIGELIRAHYISTKESIRMSVVLGNIVVEKLLDLVFFTIFMIFIVFFLDNSFIKSGIFLTGAILILIFVGALVYLLLLAKTKQSSLQELIASLIGKIPKGDAIAKYLQGGVKGFFEGQTVSKNPFHIFIILILSILKRIVFAINIYTAGLAFGINIGFIPFLFLDVFTSLVSAFGHILGIAGSFEAGTVLGLSFFAIESEKALGLALLHDFSYFIIMSIVIIYLFYTNREEFKKYLAVGTGDISQVPQQIHGKDAEESKEMKK